MALWFAMLVLVIGCIIAYKLVRLGTDRLYPDETNSNVKEAATFDASLIGNPLDLIISYSGKYELVRNNPLQYDASDRIAVTKKYKDLLLGHIKDPNAIHAPNERRDIHLNPDYVRYLRNQARVLGPDSWHKQELKRVRQVEKEEEIGIDIRAALYDMGGHISLIHPMTTEYRMENYDQDDWNNLVKATNQYVKDNYDLGRIQLFLKYVEDTDVLLNDNMMQMFDMLLEKDVPDKIAGVCVSGTLDDEELAQILELLDQACTIDEALALVLNKKKEEIQTKIAQQAMNELLL